jgi:nucleoid-associated protein YgaU
MPRYKGQRIIKNRLRFYNFLREKRGVVTLRHYGTPMLNNPSVLQRASIAKTNHIWTYGDRYYNLAKQYYNTPTYWWVIAWWNARPTEGHIKPGDIIVIPLNLEEALEVLGSY